MRNNIVVTYGIAYIFVNSKVIVCYKTMDKQFDKNQFNIDEQVDILNGSIIEKQDFYEKYNNVIRETLEEREIIVFPMIKTIKNEQDNVVEENLMTRYKEKHFIINRYLNNGFKYVDMEFVTKYLEKTLFDKKDKIIEFDKITFRLILTTSFGEKLLEFVNSIGASSKISSNKEYKIKGTYEAFLKNIIFEGYYSQINFEQLIIDVLKWNIDYFNSITKIEEALLLINKEGQVEETVNLQYELKDYVISFLKEKSYLYIPIGRFDDEQIFRSINGDSFILQEGKVYKLISCKSKLLYYPEPVNIFDNDLLKEKEVGIIFKYEKEKVKIGIGCFKEEHNRVAFGYTLKIVKNYIKNILNNYIEDYHKYIK